MKNFIFALLVFFVSLQSIAQVTYYAEGEVVEIIDGDTFQLLTKDATLYRIKVANINCPQLGQSFGDKAKQFTSNAILNKSVKVEIINPDHPGTFAGIVFYNGSSNLNKELVRNGLAWHFVKFSNDSSLQALEDEAKSNKIGLWQDSDPVNPLLWLKANSIPPIYPGCDGENYDALKKCFSDKLNKFIKRKFDKGLAGHLGLYGLQEIRVIFKIDPEGNIIDVRAKGPHPRIEQEAIRVIKKLPKMKPGKIKGKAVMVPYSLPINVKGIK